MRSIARAPTAHRHCAVRVRDPVQERRYLIGSAVNEKKRYNEHEHGQREPTRRSRVQVWPRSRSVYVHSLRKSEPQPRWPHTHTRLARSAPEHITAIKSGRSSLERFRTRFRRPCSRSDTAPSAHLPRLHAHRATRRDLLDHRASLAHTLKRRASYLLPNTTRTLG